MGSFWRNVTTLWQRKLSCLSKLYACKLSFKLRMSNRSPKQGLLYTSRDDVSSGWPVWCQTPEYNWAVVIKRSLRARNMSCESNPEDWRWTFVSHQGCANQRLEYVCVLVCHSVRWEASMNREGGGLGGNLEQVTEGGRHASYIVRKHLEEKVRVDGKPISWKRRKHKKANAQDE